MMRDVQVSRRLRKGLLKNDAYWISEGDMPDDSVLEEGGFSNAGSVDELVELLKEKGVA